VSGRLAEIARQTVVASEDGEYRTTAGDLISIRDAVAMARDRTRLYDPGETVRPRGEPGAMRIEVTGESTLDAAHRVGDAAALVFASAKNPGGGFLGGAKAQEEDIARASALYVCLRTAAEFYDYHRHHRDLRYTDAVIYSPDVPVFRDGKGRFLDEPYRTTFLTAAAPNLGAIERNQPSDVDDVPNVLHRRARRILRIAAAHGHRTLVLGAWGCGVFRNDPATVAGVFADALREVNVFDRVVFAVYDKASGAPAYTAFLQQFGGAAEE
jgi:uncharacterized protein (TIGR02452 family)